MLIRELSSNTGVPVETIRYYEKAGLLPAPPRQANGYREYGPVHRERLAFIRHCRELGMPLSDVQRLLDFSVRPSADCGDINLLIDTHIARVRERLQGLQALERQLTGLRAQCCGPQPAAECGILQELRTPLQGHPSGRVAEIGRKLAERSLPADPDPDDPACGD